jgi:hypothetical protein
MSVDLEAEESPELSSGTADFKPISKPFCGDSGYCVSHALFKESSLSLLQSISCQEAYEKTHELSLLPMNDVFQARQSPETKPVDDSAILDARADDKTWLQMNRIRKDWLRNRKSFERRPKDLNLWMTRCYPKKLSSPFKQLERLLHDVVGQLSNSFPRVSPLENLGDSWLKKIIDTVDGLEMPLSRNSRRYEAISIFRNSDVMREFVWYMKACMHYSTKERDEKLLESFLSGLSSFFFAFSYIETKLGIHYPDMYARHQNFLVTVTNLAPPLDDATWWISFPESLSWSIPELPLLTKELVEWSHVFNDVAIPSPSLNSDSLRQFRIEFLSKILNGHVETAPDSPIEETTESLAKKSAYLFNYFDKENIDIASVCEEHSELLSETVSTLRNIPECISYQTTLSILGRCKPHLPLETRIAAFIEPIAVTGENGKLSHLGINLNVMPSDLVSRMAPLSPYALAGLFVVSAEDSDYSEAELPGGNERIFMDAITSIFETEDLYFRKELIGNCVRYKPIIDPDSTDQLEMLRGIGKLLALHMRQGYPGSHLAQYLHACAADDSVSEALFLGSHYIRKGFYDVFVEGDFERALIDGSEVVRMFETYP